MAWFSWLCRADRESEDPDPLDLDLVIADGSRNRSSARLALNQLREERKRLIRQQRSLDKQSRRPSTADIRNMGRTGPQLGPYQLSQSIQRMNEASQDSAFAEQEANVEHRMKALEHAIIQLRAVDH